MQNGNQPFGSVLRMLYALRSRLTSQLVKAATGEVVSAEELGGADLHCKVRHCEVAAAIRPAYPPSCGFSVVDIRRNRLLRSIRRACSAPWSSDCSKS